MAKNRVYTSSGWKEMGIAYHYGQLMDLDKPTTGVVTNHVVTWLGDEIAAGIDLAYEGHLKECAGRCIECECPHNGPIGSMCGCTCDDVTRHEYDPSEDHEFCAPESGTMLIGNWKRVKVLNEGLPSEEALFIIGLGDNDEGFVPDKSVDKPDAYAAIVGEIYTQVVWSKTVTRVRALCSPCFPGQADLDRPDAIIRSDDIVRYRQDSAAVGTGLLQYADPRLNYVVREIDRRSTDPDPTAIPHMRVTFVDCLDDKEGVCIPYTQLELVDGYLAYDLPAAVYGEV